MKTNPASRIHKLMVRLEEVGTADTPGTILKHWANVLGYDTLSKSHQQERVCRALAILNSDVDYVEEVLSGLMLEAGYSEVIARTRVMLDFERLMSSYSNLKDFNAPYINNGWASFTPSVPDDSFTLSAEELKRARGDLIELIDSAKSEGLTSELLHFLETNVSRMLEALEDYERLGPSVIVEATERVTGAIVISRDIIKRDPAGPAIVGRLWAITDAVAKMTINVARLAIAAKDGFEIGELITKLLGRG